MPEEPSTTNDDTTTVPVRQDNSPQETLVDVDAQMQQPPVEAMTAEPGSAPMQMPASQTAMPSGVTPPAPKKKFPIKWVALGAATIAVLIGGAAAYAWYQSPEKMLADSVMSIMTAKTSIVDAKMMAETEAVDMSMTYKIQGDRDKSQGNVTVDLTMKGEMKSIGTLKFTGDAVSDKDGTIYFKVDNVKESYTKALSAYIDSLYSDYTLSEKATIRAEADKSVLPIINEIDGQWIKATSDDMKSDGLNTKCSNDVMKKFQEDAAMRKELFTLYQKNQFVKIDKRLGSKDGNVGFSLGLDSTKAKDFVTSTKDTAFGRALLACDSKAYDKPTSTESTTSNNVKTTVEVWVGEWSHTLNRVVVNADDKTANIKLDAEMNMKYNMPVEVTIPASAKPIKQVSDKLKQLMPQSSASSSVFDTSTDTSLNTSLST